MTALAHNHSLLILDETKRAGKNERERAQNVLNMAVGLAEHTEKERLTNTGAARSCCCYFFSTSNYSLDELAERGALEIDDAERGRLVDVFLPVNGFGLYEDPHNFTSGGELTDALKARSRRFFGTPRHEFAKRLTKDRKQNERRLKRWLNQRRQEYLKKLKAKVNNMLQQVPATKPPLQRATGKFATVYAAGALAIKYGVVLLPRKKLLAAILRCQLDGLRARVVTNNIPAPSFKEKLIGYLQQRKAEFIDLDAERPRPENHQFGSVPGYIATFRRDSWLYLTAEQLNSIIGTGEKTSDFKKELAAAGLLDATKNRFVVQRPIFSGFKGNKGSRYVHAFKASILDNVTG